jgi:drug/metabolite transporter (DMT)-like permease
LLKLLLIIALFRSPTWVLVTLAVGCALLWIVRVVGWRISLAFLGLALIALVLLAPHPGGRVAEDPASIWCLGIGFALTVPWVYSEHRRERKEREARKRAEATRVRPIGPSWGNTLLGVGGLALLFALPIAGGMLDDRLGLRPNPNADMFHDAPLVSAGIVLGVIAALGMPIWAAVRERKRIRGQPKGLVGQTGEGVYVYDLNALKAARDGRANEAADAGDTNDV